MEAIRPLETADAEDLAALVARNRDFMAPFDPVHDERYFTVDGQRERLEALARDRGGDRKYGYAILDDGAVAGTVFVSNVVRGAFHSANIGYSVDQARNGRGLATAAVAAIAREAFGALGLHRLEAGTLVDNVRSQRVLERNAFTRIGLAPRYLRIAGEWRDHILFQRTAED